APSARRWSRCVKGETTMTLEPEESDDYGYDLAHEVKTALRIPVARRQRPSYRGTGRPVDPDGGDLGYDESHDL
ncbi:MAG TPA: hypothetical protein VLK57_07225, partial [Pseudonocardia sp.]|nr:hypothetical protein [Pseudonocardia sp.]